MTFTRWDPFAELNSLHDQLNSLFSDSLAQPRGTQLAPVTDVYSEGDDKIIIEVHLPNFDEDDIKAEVHDHALEIRAEHHEKQEEGNKNQRQYLVRESSTSFYRRIALPKQADEDGVKAHFDKGVLKVAVPFKELPKPKRVAIEAKAKKEAAASANKGQSKK